MNATHLVPVLVLLIFVPPAQAGYRDLKSALEAYRPPSHLSTRPRRNAPDNPTDSDRDAAFTAAVARLKEKKRAWTGELDAFAGDSLFYRPDPERVSVLAPAADDASAAALLQHSFSLPDLQTLVLLRNPGIRAASHRVRAAVEAFDQVSHLDEILRRYTAFTEGLMTGVGPVRGKDPGGVQFPFPGVVALKGQVVDYEVKEAGETLEIARREAVSAAAGFFWELSYACRAQAVTARVLELLDQLEAVTVTRYESGGTGFQDVVRIRIQRETLREKLVSLGEKQAVAETGIRQVLGLDEDVPVGKPAGEGPSAVHLDPHALADTARKRRQELRRIRFRIAKMETMIEMTETMILPRGFSMGLSVYADEAVNQVGSFAGKPAFGKLPAASTGAGLPERPWYGVRDAYLFEIRKKLWALREDLDDAASKTVTEVRSAGFDLDRAVREERLYERTVIRLSRTALDVSTREYETGDSAFADVIDAYALWLDSNLARERRRADVGIAVAELSRRVGAWLGAVEDSATLEGNGGSR